MQEIENPIDEAVVAALLQIGLQQGKAGNALVILDDQFAIEERSLRRQHRNRLGDLFEAMGPVELLARQKTHPPMIEPRLDAVAVELDLVNPFAIPWWDAMQRGEARWHEIRKSSPPPLSDRRIRAAPRGDRHGCLCRCLWF